MKTLVVYKSDISPNEEKIALSISSVLSATGVESGVFNTYQPSEDPDAIFGVIQSYRADWLITINFAGFECRVQDTHISYNGLPGRQAHIVIDDSVIETEVIRHGFVYPVYLFTIDEKLTENLSKYKTIPHLLTIPEGALESDVELVKYLWHSCEFDIDYPEIDLQ